MSIFDLHSKGQALGATEPADPSRTFPTASTLLFIKKQCFNLHLPYYLQVN